MQDQKSPGKELLEKIKEWQESGDPLFTEFANDALELINDNNGDYEGFARAFKESSEKARKELKKKTGLDFNW